MRPCSICRTNGENVAMCNIQSNHDMIQSFFSSIVSSA